MLYNIIMIRSEPSPCAWSSPCIEISANIEFQTKPSRIWRLHYHSSGFSDSLFWVWDLCLRNSISSSARSVFELHFQAPCVTKIWFRKKRRPKSKIWVTKATRIVFLHLDFKYLNQTPIHLRDLDPWTCPRDFQNSFAQLPFSVSPAGRKIDSKHFENFPKWF